MKVETNLLTHFFGFQRSNLRKGKIHFNQLEKDLNGLQAALSSEDACQIRSTKIQFRQKSRFVRVHDFACLSLFYKESLKKRFQQGEMAHVLT